jgi:hypothetical protein
MSFFFHLNLCPAGILTFTSLRGYTVEKEKVNTFQKKTEKRKLFHWEAGTKSKDRTKKILPGGGAAG